MQLTPCYGHFFTYPCRDQVPAHWQATNALKTIGILATITARYHRSRVSRRVAVVAIALLLGIEPTTSRSEARLLND